MRTLLSMLFVVLSLLATARTHAQEEGPVLFGRQAIQAQGRSNMTLQRSGNQSATTHSGSTVEGVTFRVNPNIVGQNSGSNTFSNTSDTSPRIQVGSTGVGVSRSDAVAYTPPPAPVVVVSPQAGANSPSSSGNGKGGAGSTGEAQPKSGQSKGQSPSSSIPRQTSQESTPSQGGKGSSGYKPYLSSEIRVPSSSSGGIPAQQVERAAEADVANNYAGGQGYLQRRVAETQIARNELEMRSGPSVGKSCTSLFDCTKAPSLLSNAETISVAGNYLDMVAKGQPMTDQQREMGKIAVANAAYGGFRDFSGAALNMYGQLRGAGKIADAVNKQSGTGTEITPITPIPNRTTAGTPQGNQQGISNSNTPALPPPRQ